MRIGRKDWGLIAAAVLLLCAVSAYRQLSLRFLPGDPIRPFIVYFAYLSLLASWWVAVRRRVTQDNMRFFLLAEQAFMLLGITTRFVQDAFLYRDTYLMRVSGYWIAVPIIILPLLGLYASFGLGKAEYYRINRKWYCLLIPAAVLSLLTVTNEGHSLIFLASGNGTPDLSFHANIGIYIVFVWASCLELIRCFLIFRRSRELEGHSYLKLIPFLVTILMLASNIPYIYHSFVPERELVEYLAFVLFSEAMIWEACIIVGMVPVNTHYGEVFDRSTIAMQLLDGDGRVLLRSSRAPELSMETLSQLGREQTVLTPEGMELHLHAVRGGCCVWQNDVSRTLAAMEELRESSADLERKSALLRNQEQRARSSEAAVEEKNQIYNRLTDEIGEQLSLLRNLLAKREWAEDKPALFKKICLIGTYVKRRCDLRLSEQLKASITNNDLALCYGELVSCFRRLGMKADMHWNTSVVLAPEFAIFTLDLFEFLLEYEQFEMNSITVSLGSDAAFSVGISSNVFEPQTQVPDFRRINKPNYDLIYRTLEDGYLVSARNGGS